MAGHRPLFVTGGNAKIKVNGKTLAFCTDISYSVQIITQTPKILGMYEGSSVEPLGYSVSGAFTVIRYAKDVVENTGGAPLNYIAENDAGNGVGNWGGVWGGKAGDFFARNGIGNDGRANEAMDPSKFQKGVSFEIQIYQKTANGEDIGVANIRHARITQADFSLNKKGVATQRFTFVALYADEDSFAAGFSGQGQHFQG
jgi:hypothetical protein